MGSDPKDKISDGVGVGIGATPADGVTVRGAHPDHALLTPCLAQAVGVVDVGRPVASPLIEVLPGGRLNGEGHWSFRFDVISLQGQRGHSCPLVDSVPAVTVPRSSPPFRRHRWQDHPSAPRHQWHPGSDQSARPSCNAGISPRQSQCLPRDRSHMPWRCCRETHRCRSTGQRSRSRSLPNRCRKRWRS